jgi:hypothetical protein
METIIRLAELFSLMPLNHEVRGSKLDNKIGTYLSIFCFGIYIYIDTHTYNCMEQVPYCKTNSSLSSREMTRILWIHYRGHKRSHFCLYCDRFKIHFNIIFLVLCVYPIKNGTETLINIIF